MDITRVPDFPIDMLKQWETILAKEMEHTQLQIADLEATIALRKKELEISKEFVAFVHLTIAFKEIDGIPPKPK